MDSLTQIVLGAAVGEATLGRKVGNRAMLWGGIAGTLPDLDVLANAVTDPMSALAYHRAFTHSVTFAVLAAPIIGLIVHKIYGGRSQIPFVGLFLALGLLITGGSLLMPIPVYGIPKIAGLITLVFGAICGVVALRERYRKRPSSNGNASVVEWTLLFFFAIVTHPLLDCFTAYGTQFLEPFTANRIAWDTISVVDPLYTLPFLLLVILAARKGRESRVRRNLNRAGLVVSSLYLLLTVINYFNVGAVLDDTLARREIVAEHTSHGPTIFNNLLWTATARTDGDHYYIGQYSLLDSKREFGPFVEIDGHHDWLADYAQDRDLRILEWFTGGQYAVIPLDSGRVQVSDLRYGLIGEDPQDPASYIFSWQVDTTSHPIRVIQQQSGPQRDGSEMVSDMWRRMKGN